MLRTVPDWGEVALGDSTDDDALETVLRSIRWSSSPAPVVVTMAVQPNVEYRLQLLFHEQCCSRGFDIFVGGAAIVEAYSPQVEQGGVSEAGRPGALVTYSFAAQSAQLAVELQSTPDDEVSTTARQNFPARLRLSHG